VLKFERGTERCPAQEFLDNLQKPMGHKFAGQFDALTKTGQKFCNQQRFWPLHKKGKPLWEFKEHDHRLYCFRRVETNGAVTVVLFNGWVKDKKGRTGREDREIEKALDLYNEFLREFPEGGAHDKLLGH
jgi:hypothetical protein